MDRKKPADKRGGYRPGAGRPKGSKNVLGLGEVSAVKALGLRVPENAKPEHRELADESFATIVKIMRGEIKGPDAPMRRATAKDIREEICGPIAKQVNVAGPDGGALQVSVSINRTVKEPEPTQVPPERAEEFDPSDVEGVVP